MTARMGAALLVLAMMVSGLAARPVATSNETTTAVTQGVS